MLMLLLMLMLIVNPVRCLPPEPVGGFASQNSRATGLTFEFANRPTSGFPR